MSTNVCGFPGPRITMEGFQIEDDGERAAMRGEHMNPYSLWSPSYRQWATGQMRGARNITAFFWGFLNPYATLPDAEEHNGDLVAWQEQGQALGRLLPR